MRVHLYKNMNTYYNTLKSGHVLQRFSDSYDCANGNLFLIYDLSIMHGKEIVLIQYS